MLRMNTDRFAHRTLAHRWSQNDLQALPFWKDQSLLLRLWHSEQRLYSRRHSQTRVSVFGRVTVIESNMSKPFDMSKNFFVVWNNFEFLTIVRNNPTFLRVESGTSEVFHFLSNCFPGLE